MGVWKIRREDITATGTGKTAPKYIGFLKEAGGIRGGVEGRK